MKYARIVVKNNYQEKGDLVLRELVRAFRKLKLDSLIINDGIIIPGVVFDKGIVYIPFTEHSFEYHYYEDISEDEFKDIISSLSLEQQYLLNIIIRKYIFKENIEIEDVSSMEDLSYDRMVELEAFDSGLSTINPYEIGHLNDYNDFFVKCSESERVLKKVV